MNFIPVKSPIARRFILYIIVFSSVITLGTTALQLYNGYETDLDYIQQDLELVEAVHLESITAALWSINRSSLQTISEGILNSRGIEFVEIKDEAQSLLAKAGVKQDHNIIKREYPIVHPQLGQNINIGTLTVIVSLDGVYQRLIDTVWIILISNAFKTSLVAIFIFALFYRLVARHIYRVAEFSRKVDIDNLDSSFQYDRPDNPIDNQDEFDVLKSTLLKMQQNLGESTSLIRQREVTLFQNQQRFQDFAESSSDWFWEMDANLKFTYCSDRFFLLTGFSTEQVYGTGRDAYIDPEKEDIESNKWQQYYSRLEKREAFKNFEFEIIKQNNDPMFLSSSGNPVFNAKGEFTGYRGTGSDITERKILDAKLSYQASHDALTGLISRYEFEQRVTRLLSSISEEQTAHAICFLDLDQFKVINDTCGHAAGDELLRQLGRTLRQTIRKRDTLARLGGDEFGVLMEHCTLEQAHRVADDILKAIMDYQFFWDGNKFRIGVSIGLVAISEGSGKFTDLLKQADAACYLAKDLGRNRIIAYHPDDTELAVRHGEMQWVGRISQALEDDRLCLYAQPILSLDGGGRRHYELLIRMLDEQGGIIPPGAFLPAAERYNLVEKLDAWVVNHACIFMAKQPTFINQIDFVTINLSGPSLTNQNFLESTLRIFKETGVTPDKICFEVTETVAVSNLDSAIDFIRNLKEIGCQFALDDFGSGISSFGYLKSLPVDYLKIDGMFVKDIVDDPIDYAMVKSINEIGQVMGMKTIAEFVENDEIKKMLKTIGVNYAQGYGLGKPEPLEDLITQPDKT